MLITPCALSQLQSGGAFGKNVNDASTIRPARYDWHSNIAIGGRAPMSRFLIAFLAKIFVFAFAPQGFEILGVR